MLNPRTAEIMPIEPGDDIDGVRGLQSVEVCYPLALEAAAEGLRRVALEALVAVYAGDDEWVERVAYRATAHHLEGENGDLALGIWRAVGVEPRKKRRRGGLERKRPGIPFATARYNTTAGPRWR